MRFGIDEGPPPPPPPPSAARGAHRLPPGEPALFCEAVEGAAAAAAAVEAAFVRLAEGWHECELCLRLAGGAEPALLRLDLPFGEGAELEAERDLALMVSTEWAVKAAGALVLQLRRMGSSATLLMPAPLRPENNAYIAQRNKAWAARKAM